jgi:HEAT repeat protein
VQRGVVQPLIRMLEASDPRLREMAAFALGCLAQVLIAVALVFVLFFVSPCLVLFVAS